VEGKERRESEVQVSRIGHEQDPPPSPFETPELSERAATPATRRARGICPPRASGDHGAGLDRDHAGAGESRPALVRRERGPREPLPGRQDRSQRRDESTGRLGPILAGADRPELVAQPFPDEVNAAAITVQGEEGEGRRRPSPTREQKQLPVAAEALPPRLEPRAQRERMARGSRELVIPARRVVEPSEAMDLDARGRLASSMMAAVRRPLPPLALAYHGAAYVPYHRDPMRLFVGAAAIRRDIRLLRGWGYQLVTFGELARRAAGGAAAGAAALTFDDGLADNLHVLAPLLAELGAPATVFVVTGWLGRPHPDAPFARVLTGSEVQRLHALGLEIGTHTDSHRDLTTVAPGAAREDFARSRAILEDLVGSPVRVAAYPYGAANVAVRAACRDVGLMAACRTAGEGNWQDPFDLPREAMANGSSATGLRLKRTGWYGTLTALPGARRTRRLSRRLHSWWSRPGRAGGESAPAHRPSAPR
jgi:peptidoglycan/xylan/chitin deacetylase (PgdA/CDA1 family)